MSISSLLNDKITEKGIGPILAGMKLSDFLSYIDEKDKKNMTIETSGNLYISYTFYAQIKFTFHLISLQLQNMMIFNTNISFELNGNEIKIGDPLSKVEELSPSFRIIEEEQVCIDSTETSSLYARFTDHIGDEVEEIVDYVPIVSSIYISFGPLDENLDEPFKENEDSYLKYDINTQKIHKLGIGEIELGISLYQSLLNFLYIDPIIRNCKIETDCMNFIAFVLYGNIKFMFNVQTEKLMLIELKGNYKGSYMNDIFIGSKYDTVKSRLKGMDVTEKDNTLILKSSDTTEMLFNFEDDKYDISQENVSDKILKAIRIVSV